MKTFNVIVTGYGGQGILSLAEIIEKAAFKEGHDVRGVELHGLAQRGGPLQCQLRFGEKVYSPLVRREGADLIIALEPLEGLRACYFATAKRTAILTESRVLSPSPISDERIDINDIVKRMKEFAKRIETVNAGEIVEKLTGDTAMSNVFMLGYAIRKGMLPIKKEFAWESVAEKVRPQFLEMDKKVFEEAFKH
jgi:indolepyruvate ferredoxin oxidoreductase beta subunit